MLTTTSELSWLFTRTQSMLAGWLGAVSKSAGVDYIYFYPVFIPLICHELFLPHPNLTHPLPCKFISVLIVHRDKLVLVLAKLPLLLLLLLLACPLWLEQHRFYYCWCWCCLRWFSSLWLNFCPDEVDWRKSCCTRKSVLLTEGKTLARLVLSSSSLDNSPVGISSLLFLLLLLFLLFLLPASQ